MRASSAALLVWLLLPRCTSTAFYEPANSIKGRLTEGEGGVAAVDKGLLGRDPRLLTLKVDPSTKNQVLGSTLIDGQGRPEELNWRGETLMAGFWNA